MVQKGKMLSRKMDTNSDRIQISSNPPFGHRDSRSRLDCSRVDVVRQGVC